MPLSLQFEFTYLYDPTIPFRARAAATGLSQLASAQVDTGADRTVIDIDIAWRSDFLLSRVAHCL